MTLVLSVPAGAQSVGGWTQFQGGSEHTGQAADAPAPPYREVWRFGIERSDGIDPSPPILVGGQVIVVAPDAVYAVDAASGVQAWSTLRTQGPTTPPAVGEAGGRRLLLYTEGDSTDTARLVAVDLKTRKPAWDAPFALQAVSYSGVTVDGGTAFVGDDLGNVYAVDLASGRQLWTSKLDAGIEGAITVSDGSVLVPAQNFSRDRAEANSSTTPVLASLTALNASTGEQRWSYASEPGVQFISFPLVADGAVYLGIFDTRVLQERLVALALEDGRELWNTRIRTAGTFGPAQPPSLSYEEGALYARDAVGGLMRIDARTGSLVWDFQTNEVLVTGPPVIVANAKVLLGLRDGRLIAVDAESGHVVWLARTGVGALGALAAGSDMLVVQKGGLGGGLVAFEPDPSGELVDIRSPSEVRIGPLIGGFAIVAVLLGAVIVLLFRFIAGRTEAAEFAWEEDGDDGGGAEDPTEVEA